MKEGCDESTKNWGSGWYCYRVVGENGYSGQDGGRGGLPGECGTVHVLFEIKNAFKIVNNCGEEDRDDYREAGANGEGGKGGQAGQSFSFVCKPNQGYASSKNRVEEEDKYVLN